MECIIDNGRRVHDEDIDILEVLGLTVVINAPSLSDPLVSAHGDPIVLERTIAKFAPGASMPDRPFTYGQRIFDQGGVNQLEWMADRLRSKPETTAATIGLLIPGDTSPNLPCLVTIDAKIRPERLLVQFFFRSQNIFGRQYANLLALAKLQHSLASICGVSVGALSGYIASAHIYDFDLAQARALCAGESERIVDRYYQQGPQSVRVPL
jgi:thymidylate synthase